MELQPLTALSPIDGRYRSKTEKLDAYLSEYGLIKYRVYIEITYFIALCRIPLPGLKEIDPAVFPQLEEIFTRFSTEDAQRIKDIEKTTNHDVKAVEYFLKEKFESLGLQEYAEYIHFGLTSQDVNNTATPLSLKKALEEVLEPALGQLTEKLAALAEKWDAVPMLARTHGQPASPTRLGKEIRVFTERIEEQQKMLLQIPYAAKFGGATGNFNAHHVAFPEVDWKDFGNRLLADMGLKRSQTTTQIEHYDQLAGLLQGWGRINTILIDLARDIWSYISMEYFRQEIKKGEVGSSTMPHKVNPIDFENAEGNLGMANAVYHFMAEKLPVSRLQRDLTDSTVLRNLSVPLGHSLIAYTSLLKGLNKLILNEEALHRDLDENWAVVGEAIQTILRREGVPKPYELLKELTRTHKRPDARVFREFILGLPVSEEVKEELLQISPFNYTGI